MLIRKNYSLKSIVIFSWHHIIWLTLWSTIVAVLFDNYLNWLSIPWLPVSLIGTAVAFYLGFKNNSAYDRMWEARKIWGAIVNSSRAWGSYVSGFVTNLHAETEVNDEELYRIKRRLIYRHIVWLYTLRKQLLEVQPWEHANSNTLLGVTARMYQKRFGTGLFEDQWSEEEVKQFLSTSDFAAASSKKNMATQLINQQSEDLKAIRQQGLIDDFRHVELQKLLHEFYDEQGKCERIKKFPLPRQYASMSAYFVGIFIFLLPFGMVSVFRDLGEWGIWWSIPFTAIAGWVYMMMELVGDYSENPFQSMQNDIPTLSLTRTIEIDLREMLNETELPPPIEARNQIMM